MKNRAFTLVELLTVIAIIGILAAIIIPVTARVREQARTTRCLAQMRQVGSAFLMYVNDNRGYLPVQSTPTAQWDAEGSWTYALFPYVDNRALFTCPENQTKQVDARVPVNPMYNPYVSARLTTPVGAPVNVSRSRKPTRDVIMVEEWYASLGNAITASQSANAPDAHWYPHDGKTKRSTLYVDGHVKLTPRGGILHNGVNGECEWEWPRF
ncbi:prepilin-type N-terminal cleavage/methylation domain-containing protein [Opitutaceae bacterium TAV1]|nr:prepilin-type N-terminal cleavage/methylation domain-containing protein [Opitutaceae bacterium TAV1]